MRKTFTALITLLILTLFIAIVPTEAQGEIYEDTVRLHIIANSDSEADQTLKLKIRDKLLEKYASELKKYKSKTEAEGALEELIGEIESDVKEWIHDEGYEYSAKVTLSEEWYETREYGDFSLPCGYYTSARILLGEGDGKNWWCVMYPPLCLDLATEDAPRDDAIIGYTKEEISLISKNGYNVKFKILELISESVAFSSKNS